MPEVVADTSALQYLHQIELLDLLPTLYGSVVVPKAVVRELEEGLSRGVSVPDVNRLSWITVKAAASPKLLPLAADLGPGEREVLGLALETRQSLAIVDDALARRYARHLGIPHTGTLGILLKAKSMGHLPSVAAAVKKLEGCGFRLDPATRMAVLKLAGELEE